jgi:hypothetical protein
MPTLTDLRLLGVKFPRRGGLSNGVPTDTDPGEIPRPELSCDTPACVAALAEIVRLRNVIVFKCGQIAAAKSRANAMAAVATALLTVASGLFVAGAIACSTFWGCLAGIVLIIAAAIVAALALLFAIFAAIGYAQVTQLEHEKNQAIADFTDAADAVTKVCPTRCWGDLTAPSC